MSKKGIVIILLILIIMIAGVSYLIIEKINESNRDYKIEEISEYKYFILKSSDKYGVIDAQGKTVLEASYEKVEIPNPSKDVFICYKNEKGIAMDANKKQIFSEYNSIESIQFKNVIGNLPFEKSVLKSEKNGKYGLIDLQGKKILDTEYDNIENFSNIEGQLQIQKNNKYGVVNIKGTMLVKPEYDTILGDNYYSEETKYKEAGYIVGQKNEDGYKYGYIDSKGKLKLKLEYNDISRITEISNTDGLYLIVAKNGQYGVMENGNNIIKNEYQDIDYNSENKIFVVQKNRKYGVIDIKGKTIIPIENTNIEVKGQYIYVEKNNIKEVCNTSGEKVNIDFDNAIELTANDKYKIVITSTEKGNLYGVIGSDNKQIIKSEYLYIEYAFDDYFIVNGQNGKLGVIDSDEKTVIDLNYDLVQKVQGKNIIQTLSANTNITELYSKEMKKICEMENATLENEKDYIKIYSSNAIDYYTESGEKISNTKLFPNNNFFVSCKDGKWGYTDKNGTTKVEYEYEFATELNNQGYASIKKDGKWGCIDNNGKIVIEPKYVLGENNNKVEFIGQYVKIDNGLGQAIYTNDI